MTSTTQPTPTTAGVTEAQTELVARAIDPGWWNWADVHYEPAIQEDVRSRERSLERARRAIAALTAPPGDGVPGMVPTHRHVKRGSEYVLLGIGKMQADWWRVWIGPARDTFVTADMHEVALYRSIDDGSLWVRPREEFEDGRFVALSASTGEPKP